MQKKGRFDRTRRFWRELKGKNMAAKKTILLIEDEQNLVEMYRMQFEAAGFILESASNTKEGLQKAQEIQPALILLDLILPTNDEPADVYERAGYKLLREFKKDAKLKTIPVVVLTNLDSKKERETSDEIGAVGYWVKSQLLPKEVVEEVKKILKKK